MITYQPNACRQTADSHIHYNVVLTKKPFPPTTDIEWFKKLAAKVGGSTVGQVITNLLEKRDLGIDLSRYGVELIKTEVLPTYQICNTGASGSLSADWDQWLITPAIATTPPPLKPGYPKVAKITH